MKAGFIFVKSLVRNYYNSDKKYFGFTKKFIILSPGHSNEKGAEEIAQVDVMKYHH